MGEGRGGEGRGGERKWSKRSHTTMLQHNSHLVDSDPQWHVSQKYYLCSSEC